MNGKKSQKRSIFKKNKYLFKLIRTKTKKVKYDQHSTIHIRAGMPSSGSSAVTRCLNMDSLNKVYIFPRRDILGIKVLYFKNYIISLVLSAI